MVVTAACCIIGDEILSGKTKDTNSHYLAKKLFDLGIELKSIQVVGDDTLAIQRCVKELSSRYDLVFTSGGIGPTHDDITYASIAAAYNLDMKLDQVTYDYIQEATQQKMGPYHARMATFPHPARLIRNTKIPVVVVHENIYILPGIPRLFKLLLDSLEFHSDVRFYRQDIVTQLPEVAIADVLTKIQEAARDVRIGSYPVWDQKQVVVSVSGTNEVQVIKVSQEIMQKVNGWIPSKV